MTSMPEKAAVLGLRAQRGGAVVVAVGATADVPQLILSTWLATGAPEDPLSMTPYGVAAALPRSPDGGASAEAVAVVAEGRRRQAALAAAGLADISARLRASGLRLVGSGLLVNRAGWITDLLDYSLFAPEHPAVAEGLGVRDALRSALAGAGVAVSEVDEKSLPDAAPQSLAVAPAEIDRQLAQFGAAAGRPWRKEQKLAALAAWTLLPGETSGEA